MRALQQVEPKRPASKRFQREERIINEALNILYKRLQQPIMKGEISLPSIVKFLTMLLAEEEREVLLVVYLDTQNQIISVEELFAGTIRMASVHPREVAKSAMKINAAGIVLCHNHLGGNCSPSEADRRITRKIICALALVDVLVVDHIIISKESYFSFEEAGLLDVLKMSFA